MSIINIIKNILIPAVKGEIKKAGADAVEYTLYHEQVELREVTPVPYPHGTNHEQTRVIGPIITRY